MAYPNFPPLDQKLPWNKSQADFVSHVLFYTALGILRNDAGNLQADDMGELFLKVYDVDLSPYPDFRTMRIAVGPREDPDLLFAKYAFMAQHVRDVDDMLEGTGVELSGESKLDLGEALAIVLDLRARLSRHVGPWPGMRNYPGFDE